MAIFGQVVIWIVMAFAVAGAIASCRNDKDGIGREFLEGLYAIGYIFIPVAGIMASVPFISRAVLWVVGPLFSWLGADPAIAATSLIAVDMGGYQLAASMAQSKESWIIAMMAGYVSGATIVFSIPVALSMVDQKDHRYLALGFMSGILAVPIAVFTSCAILAFSSPAVREVVATQGESTYVLDIPFLLILKNLLPLVLFVVLIALGLRFFTRQMLRGFAVFGKILEVGVRLVLVFSIVEYFTSVFTVVFGGWGFDPIFADPKDLFRALEISGYIGVMLAGAFPMVYCLRTYFRKPLSRFGERLGLEGPGVAGFIASIANILAMFRLIPEMRPKDKVLNVAFAVCAAFLLGDHLAFTANFQPQLIFAVMVGKITGGLFGVWFAYRLAVPQLGLVTKA